MAWQQMAEKRSLKGAIALVTGASRGAGKGIACVLGEAGATVYVTGRSSRLTDTTEGLPGTIEDTAEEATRRGGTGIAVQCDHTKESENRALVERIRAEQGQLDILVNNAWGGYEYYDEANFSAPFWRQPLERWDSMFESGVKPFFLMSAFTAPLMIERKKGLIINTTSPVENNPYFNNLHYYVSKIAVNRMAYGLAQELREHNVAAVALEPGFMRTERVMAAHAIKPFDLSTTESVEYIGRAVALLASDPNIMEQTGKLLAVGDLATKYGFTDLDGRTPPRWKMQA